MRLPLTLASWVAALRALLVLTVVLGLGYPLLVTGLSRVPGLAGRADGSLVTSTSGAVVGSRLIGQSSTTADGDPLPQYFQSRPSAGGYDPTATGAANLGPESVVDTLPVAGDEGTQSLLTQVCTRSLAVGELEGVSGARPFCTADGVGAVLAVSHADGLAGPVTRVVSVDQACPATPFVASWAGAPVECATPGADLTGAVITPVRGDATPVVPSDAVTASGSGLDPDISPAYARLQTARIARERGVSTADVARLVEAHTSGRALGFLGEPAVHVLPLNLALDAAFGVAR